ncbi:hypothetical protein [Rhodospirillaceae bacterium SYSU D60014]|uniref:hypothetical protein n=1 Tax=Virgifigura deserti TaxID=2268457 RepID=UPI0013C522DB
MPATRKNSRSPTRTVLRRLMPSEHGLFVLLFLVAMGFVMMPFIGQMQARGDAITSGCQRLAFALSAEPESMGLLDASGTHEVWMQAPWSDADGAADGGIETTSVRCRVEAAWSRSAEDRARS